MNVPLLLQLGGDDRIIDSNISANFYETYRGEDKAYTSTKAFFTKSTTKRKEKNQRPKSGS